MKNDGQRKKRDLTYPSEAKSERTELVVYIRDNLSLQRP